MPIEIKELHVRVAVNALQNEQSTGTHALSPDEGQVDEGAFDKDAIVAECVEQVLQVLMNKRER